LSVGITQLSDAGVGDESTVVSQVAWDVRGRTDTDEQAWRSCSWRAAALEDVSYRKLKDDVS